MLVYDYVDFTGHEVRNAVLQNLATNPTPLGVGHMYFNSGTNKIRSYNGSSWDEYGTSTASGDVVGPSSSVDSEVALFSGTTGKIIKRATGTGVVKITSGVLSVSTRLTEIDGLSASNDDIIQQKAGVWTNRTMAQLRTDLGVDTDTTLASNSDAKIASQKAIKAYVDNLYQGISWKAFAVAATTGAETFTISGGAVTTINGTTVDGVTLAINDRVLIKNAPASTGTGSSPETTQPANGIYIVTGNTTNLSVSRATDADTGTELKQAAVFVQQGTSNADNAFVCSTDGSITINTTSITFTPFSSATVPNATTSISGKVQLATQAEAEAKSNSTKAVTPAALTKFGIKYTTTIGDGSSTSFAITHNLGTKYATVACRKASTDEMVYPKIVNNTTNQTTITFTPYAPSSNEFEVTIIG